MGKHLAPINQSYYYLSVATLLGEVESPKAEPGLHHSQQTQVTAVTTRNGHPGT
jgi:hypothetical protein